MPIATEIIRDASRFAALRAEWNALLQQSDADCVFLTWEWLHTWVRHLLGGRRLAILAVRRDNELIALAPFAVRAPQFKRLVPYPAFEFLGSGTAGSDYLDIIVRRGDEWAGLSALREEIRRAGIPVELGQLPCERSQAARLAAVLAQEGWHGQAESVHVCPFIDLSGHTWESYLATLGADHRYNFNRRLKNLHRRFDVRFEAACAETQRAEALRLLVALHEMRWRDRGEPSDAFHTPGHIAFHEEFTRLALELGWLRLFVLRLDGVPVSALYGFRYGRTLSFYQSGFDPGYGRYSVGLVTMGLAIRKAIEEGAGEYDLLHGAEAYKWHWAREARALERRELFPAGARGALWARVSRLARGTRRMARRVLPEGLAERLAAPAAVGTTTRSYVA